MQIVDARPWTLNSEFELQSSAGQEILYSPRSHTFETERQSEPVVLELQHQRLKILRHERQQTEMASSAYQITDRQFTAKGNWALYAAIAWALKRIIPTGRLQAFRMHGALLRWIALCSPRCGTELRNFASCPRWVSGVCAYYYVHLYPHCCHCQLSMA
jgi:hypothetical protein